MSVLVLQGPRSVSAGAGPNTENPHRLHGDVVASLLASAASAGRTLAIRACATTGELLDVLIRIREQPPEFLLLDYGSGVGDPAIGEALRRLAVPYIEVHDDECAHLEADRADASAERVSVVHGYRDQGYALAMAQALDYLGCAECAQDYHVGT